ncbi:hypothetical protein [Paraglaciecola sp. L1A13]|uniref:hypothetical protein n=1 Tax=Paraglaciecola sp. L1A13 TaxID=2686359 RepID=UPI00131C1327|nr:hypothetical protein [Paraglaciecola sp. L1A13]
MDGYCAILPKGIEQAQWFSSLDGNMAVCEILSQSVKITMIKGASATISTTPLLHQDAKAG